MKKTHKSTKIEFLKKLKRSGMSFKIHWAITLEAAAVTDKPAKPKTKDDVVISTEWYDGNVLNKHKIDSCFL